MVNFAWRPSKQFMTGAGLVGLAVYQVSTGLYPDAVQTVIAALVLFGLVAEQRKTTEQVAQQTRMLAAAVPYQMKRSA